MKITSPGESPLLLLKVITLLNRHKVPYAIIGAFAASFYGHLRASVDADALISVDGEPKILEKITDALKKNKLEVVVRYGDRDDPVKGVVCIEDQYRNRVDLLTGIRRMPADVFKRAFTTTFMHRRIKIVCLEDFIAMKIFAGSSKDIDDVRNVLFVSGARVERSLLKRITAGYGKREAATLNRLLKVDRSKGA